jgi:hypothetical protein
MPECLRLVADAVRLASGAVLRGVVITGRDRVV